MPFVEIDGLLIHYQTVGDPARNEGQRVLYVHGTGCNTRVWEDHMAVIADAHTPAAIDLPGHGQSQGRGFRGVADYAHFAVELARRLGWDRFVMAGHSMGYADSTPQAIVDEVEALTEGTNPWVTYADWIADDAFDAMTRVREIRIPALAVCGEEDRLTPVKYHEYLGNCAATRYSWRSVAPTRAARIGQERGRSVSR